MQHSFRNQTSIRHIEPICYNLYSINSIIRTVHMLIKTPPSNKNHRIEIGLRIWNNKTHHPKNFPAREARRKFFWTLLAVLQGENAKKRSFWGSQKLK